MMLSAIVSFAMMTMGAGETSLMRLVFSLLLFPCVLYSWYRVMIHRNHIFLFNAIGISFLLGAMLFEGVGGLLLFLALGVVFMFMGGLFFFQVSPLWVYPTAIASAERETNEYLNGYSQRPVTVKFMKYNRENMKRFTSFLLRYIVIWDRRAEGQTVTLFFRPAMSFLPRLKKSYIKLHRDGTAEVYITKEDYDYLKTPISYHLLCRNVARRIKRAYKLFVDGDEKGALEVFRVDRKKTAS